MNNEELNIPEKISERNHLIGTIYEYFRGNLDKIEDYKTNKVLEILIKIKDIDSIVHCTWFFDNLKYKQIEKLFDVVVNTKDTYNIYLFILNCIDYYEKNISISEKLLRKLKNKNKKLFDRVIFEEIKPWTEEITIMEIILKITNKEYEEHLINIYSLIVEKAIMWDYLEECQALTNNSIFLKILIDKREKELELERTLI